MDFETIIYEKRGPIAIITLNRVKRHNAINSVMSCELPQAWEDIKADPAIRAVVVTGAGPKALCTGIDVMDVASGTARVGKDEDRGKYRSLKFTALQNQCWKPVVTAVNGMAQAGGLHFVADSDLVICSKKATFFDSHVKVGLVAGCEPIGLIRRMAFEPVMRMAVAGLVERMNAERALELGLVSEALEPEKLLDRALELAGLIAKNAPTAVAESKKAIWESLNLGDGDAEAMGQKLIQQYAGHSDSKEAESAKRDARAPNWAEYGA